MDYDLKNIDTVIQNFSEWGKPWDFVEFVKSNLDSKDFEYFELIMKIALEFENWNHSDLVIGCKTTHQRLKNETELSDKAIANIVRSASYSWR